MYTGVIAEDESAYDDPGNPGVYSFDGWEPYGDDVGPSQTGGSRTNSVNVTWSAEFKFTSRFFHIYVLGRGWNTEADRAQGVRRLHAIYDAEKKRVICGQAITKEVAGEDYRPSLDLSAY